MSFIENSTHPDISYAVNYLSRNQENSSLVEWRPVKWVNDYLRGISDLWVTFNGNTSEYSNVECFVDASYASDKRDHKSTSGYYVKMFGDTILWKNKKQVGVSTSSTEAEYIALISGFKEAVIWNVILGRTTGEEIVPVVLEDNVSAKQSDKSRNTGRLKHVDICYH